MPEAAGPKPGTDRTFSDTLRVSPGFPSRLFADRPGGILVEAPMQLTTLIPLHVIITGCLMGSFAVLGNMLYFMMIGKINERVPEKERISYFWWGTEVRKRYKQLYPASRFVLLADLCVILMVPCFLFLIRFWVFGKP
jgi:hypothetical protein